MSDFSGLNFNLAGIKVIGITFGFTYLSIIKLYVMKKMLLFTILSLALLSCNSNNEKDGNEKNEVNKKESIAKESADINISFNVEGDQSKQVAGLFSDFYGVIQRKCLG
jgi:hypothetical protein